MWDWVHIWSSTWIGSCRTRSTVAFLWGAWHICQSLDYDPEEEIGREEGIWNIGREEKEIVSKVGRRNREGKGWKKVRRGE